jgi:hypothetical protein
VFELTVKVAWTPLNLTKVVPVKFVPVIVTDVPTGPLVGLNDVIVGAPGPVTLKFVALVAVPPGVVTAINPVVAPIGTVAVICVSLLKVNAAAGPPKVTAVTPVKFVPKIVTDVPTGPLIGVKAVIVGRGAVTSKLDGLIAVPSESVTSILPSLAPEGTVAVIRTSELTVNVAAVPLNVTADTSLPS